MTGKGTEHSFSHRWRYLSLLLLVATGIQLVRIWNVQSSSGEMPFLSANDRSRWCTILSLTTGNGFVIDDVLEIRDAKTRRRTWYSIDIVQHRGTDGKQHFYSSKPPLLSTLYAGVYWILRSVTGATLTEHPFFVVRVMLVVVNLIPLLGLWWLLIRWASRELVSNAQLAAMAIFVAFGTFLSTFVITLNNHLPAAVSTALSLACLLRVMLGNDCRTIWFVGCGIATSFTACAELPALSWVLISGALLGLVNWRKTLFAYVPSTIPIVFAFLASNYLAHGTFRPAYSMRGLGELIVEVNWPLTGPPSPNQSEENPNSQGVSDSELVQLGDVLRGEGFSIGPQPIVRKARREGVWEMWDASSQQKFGLKWNSAGDRMGIYQWGDWYDFPSSYWKEDRKQGVDRGEPSLMRYAFHCLIGHHGIFSLTPFWFVSLVGAACAIWRTPRTQWWSNRQFPIVIAIVATSAVVMMFYLTRPLEDRNYGGVTSGLRWMFWCIPLWCWLAIRGIQEVTRGWQWAFLLLILSMSVLSASLPWGNPWTTPWLSRWIPL